MIYLKYFESIENVREVNIKKLWNDYIKYKDILNKKGKLNIVKKSDINAWSSDGIYAETFVNNVIIPIIKNKYIAFNRVKNRFTDEITNNFKGVVKDVFMEIEHKNSIDNRFNIIVHIDDNDKLYLIKMELRESFYFPKKDKSDKIEDTILIRDSEKCDIEKSIDVLNSVEKFNL